MSTETTHFLTLIALLVYAAIKLSASALTLLTRNDPDYNKIPSDKPNKDRQREGRINEITHRSSETKI